MKKLGFHRGVYVEGLRNLSTLGWLSLILTAVFCSLPHALEILQNGVWDANVYNESAAMFYNDIEYIFPVLYALPFLLPVVFAAKLFAFQNNRRDSDFYHSLPVTRSTLHLSLLAAVATWCAVVVIGSSLVVFPLGALAEGPPASDTVLGVAAAIVSCLFVMSVVFLGYTLSGNTMSALFASGILLFAPTVISIALAETMVYDIQVVHVTDLVFSHYQLLYGNYQDWRAWLVTALVTLLCLGLGLWVGARRPSETAGQPSITPKLQHLFRLLAAFTVCLWPITELYVITSGCQPPAYYNVTQILQGYLVALAVYFLFELITTRKVKNLVKAIPWLGILAAMNVVCLLGMHATVFTFKMIDQDNYDDVSWVQVVEPVDYWSYEKKANGAVEAHSRPHVDSVDPFEFFTERYVDTMCPEVKLESDSARYITQEAIKRTLRYRDEERTNGLTIVDQMARNAKHASGYMYQVKLRVKIGFIARTRLVYVYEYEMQSLLKQINESMTVPHLDTILAWNYKGVI